MWKYIFSSCLLCFTFIDFCHKQLIDILCEYYGSFVLETPRGSGFKLWWGRDFPHPYRLVLRSTQSPLQWVQGLFLWGKVAVAWCWPPSHIYCQGCEWVELSIPLLPLCLNGVLQVDLCRYHKLFHLQAYDIPFNCPAHLVTNSYVKTPPIVFIMPFFYMTGQMCLDIWRCRLKAELPLWCRIWWWVRSCAVL